MRRNAGSWMPQLLQNSLAKSARNELQAVLSALVAQVQVAKDTVNTLADHVDLAQPPLMPADSEAAEAEAAAAAAELTAVFSSAFLAGILDQEGVLGVAVNIGVGEALHMRDEMWRWPRERQPPPLRPRCRPRRCGSLRVASHITRRLPPATSLPLSV